MCHEGIAMVGLVDSHTSHSAPWINSHSRVCCLVSELMDRMFQISRVTCLCSQANSTMEVNGMSVFAAQNIDELALKTKTKLKQSNKWSLWKLLKRRHVEHPEWLGPWAPEVRGGQGASGPPTLRPRPTFFLSRKSFCLRKCPYIAPQ